MNFLIDYDTLSVECKSEDADVLQQYISDNDLGLALAIISEEDDMLMEMSLKEISGLYHKLSDRPRKFELEEEAAKATFALLEDTDEEYPVFTPALGKTLLKAAAKRSKDAPAPKGTANSKSAGKSSTVAVTGGKVSRAKPAKVTGVMFVKGSNPPRSKSIHAILTNFIDENMGEASFEELSENFAGTYTDKDGNKKDEKFAKGYIMGAIKKGFIEEGL